jgi:hypothetical protein
MDISRPVAFCDNVGRPFGQRAFLMHKVNRVFFNKNGIVTEPGLIVARAAPFCDLFISHISHDWTRNYVT